MNRSAQRPPREQARRSPVAERDVASAAAPDLGSLEDLGSLAERVLEVVPQAMRRIRTRMRTHDRGELTVPQLRLLLYVRRRPGVGLSAVAEHIGVTKAAASTLVDRLVRAGRLDRSDDPDERRRIRLQLTADGAERVGLAHLAVRGWLAAELAVLDPEQLAHLAPALEVLDAIANRAEPA